MSRLSLGTLNFSFRGPRAALRGSTAKGGSLSLKHITLLLCIETLTNVESPHVLVRKVSLLSPKMTVI